VCIYYFTHWWEPWKSNDEAIRQDLRRLLGLGFNTLLLDHEWSQAIDGDWKLLDRANRLAAESGMSVVPWLSPKTWCDITPGHRQQKAREWFGVEVKYGLSQDGKPAAPLIYDEAIITAGTKYTLMYLDRYLSGPVLRLAWQGKLRPVVSLSVETAWDGSFDDATNERFRRWLEGKYGTIAALNAAWGTALASFAAVDPRDKAVLDYAGQVAGKAAHPQAVEDHVAFRAGTIASTLREIGAAVRRKYPEVLFLAETPYQYESRHPHAENYRIGYGANPESCDWAEVVLFRCTGPLTPAETEALHRHEQRTGQRFVLTYRTYSDWDVTPQAGVFQRSVETYAGQAAGLGSGFGFYSFNEMVDTHVAFSSALPADQQAGWTAERAERAIGLMGAMAKRYLELVK
jgi:hypothetical protein